MYIRKNLLKDEDFNVVNFNDFTIEISNKNESICVEDKLLLKMLKKKKNLLNLSEFLKQLDADNRFIFKETLREKLVVDIKIKNISNILKTLNDYKGMEFGLLQELLKEYDCNDECELLTLFYKEQDILEERNADLVILKDDIRRIKLDRKRVAHIIQNGVTTKLDIKLLKRYNFISFCK